MTRFGLSEIQANAILEMRLARLTGLERQKIEDEYLEVIKWIESLRAILASPAKVLTIIKDELAVVKEKYGDDRRTRIEGASGDFEIEDLIAEEDMVITLSHAGYIKRLPLNAYRSQRRGGRGITGAGTREEDFIQHLFVASTHAYMLVFTDRGRVHWVKVHEIPQAGRAAKGKAIVNLVDMGQTERVAAVLTVKEFTADRFLMMATANGTVKKTALDASSNPRRGGIVAIGVVEGDRLIDVVITDGTQDIILSKRDGQAIRFRETDVRAMGRTAHGVRGMQLRAGDAVVAMEVVSEVGSLLTVCANGYGKRTDAAEYRRQSRGGIGLKNVQTTDRNGPVVGLACVTDRHELLLVTVQGQIIRMKTGDLRPIGRATQGVRLMDLTADDQIVSIATLIEPETIEPEVDENGDPSEVPDDSAAE
jgi:DNA gyrase subunit A